MEFEIPVFDRRFSGASFECEPGSLVYVLGRNGAGKSTILRSIAGVAGAAESSGRPVGVYLGPEPTWVFPLSVGEAVELGTYHSRRSDPEKAVVEAVRVFGLAPLLHRSMDQLSGGEIQRVALARSFVQGPEVLLLDEVLSRLDLDYQYLVLDALRGLRQEGCICFCVTHDIALAFATSERYLIVDQGRVLDHQPVTRDRAIVLLERVYLEEYRRTKNVGVSVSDARDRALHPLKGIIERYALGHPTQPKS